ncbi:hypothetical protein COCMIDRAFT_38114 [Bipolaris oryzae ATCC 44560]|uniref:Heterokaryon incompatibility domain-containing protein n=1 Tax=Bipolaris oryzae ATCC 44560 TaxID=930090 RepID=W6Z2N1_COCMI|nr:uncharacterized protein COCMIDRAFT_38114 [Bipolaris oryzae ATCC 44560]EUC43988.1 hypothetical protein COCMIDRAFT_38114 [Bipolaris oryzae ATCC 44560]
MASTSLYQPLDPTREEFRLLRIHPTNIPESIISCQLFTASLAEEPLDITKPIIVNGVRVQVTPNLEAALRRIRPSDSEVTLWVDAVCINQQDLDERNVQVAMMSKLYSKTMLTYAWLGEDDDGSAERVFSFIRGFVGDFTNRVKDIDHFTTKFGKGQCDNMYFGLRDYIAQNLRDGKSALGVSGVLDMRLVFSRSYWYRTWIHQELFLPSKVSMLSGSVSISFNMMIVLGDIIIVQFSTPNQATGALLDFVVSNITMSYPTGTTFLQALCCNILGYRSVDDFQYRVSMYDIRTFLHWILDYGKEKPMLYGRFPAFVDQNNVMAVFEFVPDEISMSLRFAAVTGALDHLVEPYKDAKDHSAFLSITPQQRMAPFWGSESYPDAFQADIEWKIPSECVNLETMRRRTRDWADRKILIVTEKGYIGFATRGVSVGDDVCIVAGCPYPTIIRPSGSHYQVIGGGFIFEMMDGELFRDGHLTNDSQQTFEFV